MLIVVRLATDTVLISQMALGLGTGSLIAGIALGVVLTYRGSGVVDFSKGAVAIFIGYVFHELRTNGRIVIPPLPNPLALVEGVVNSGRSKPDWIDLPNWPTFIDLPGARQTFVSALVISVIFAALLGLILHFVVFRPLRFAPPLAKVVASVGLLIVFQAIIQLRFGGTTLLPQKILDDKPRHFFGDIVIPQNQLVLALLVIALAAILYALFRFTRFGLATRAAAENEKGAIVLGFSPDFLAGANWVLATVIVGLFGIIVSPITTLDPISVPLLIVPALGAALLGGFTSFGITVGRRPRDRHAPGPHRVLQRQELVPGRVDPRRRPGQVAPVHRDRHRHVRAGKEPARAGHHRRRAPAVRAVAPPRADPGGAGHPRPRSSGCSASASTGARPSSTPSSSP